MKLALLGRDVSASKSKVIHEFLIGASYDLNSVPEEEFDGAARAAMKAYDGFNVTMPYKKAILPYLAVADEIVLATGSCNTVKITGGKAFGYSTDGEGFLRSLGGFDVFDQEVLLLGAGGAAYAVAHSLGAAGAKLTVCNRTREKAEEMVEKLKIHAIVADKEMCFSKKYAIIVNSTSVGMKDEQLPIELSEKQKPKLCVDLIYRDTAFLKRARQLGAKTIDGLPMLVYQAAAADRIFTGGEVEEKKVGELLSRLYGEENRI